MEIAKINDKKGYPVNCKAEIHAHFYVTVIDVWFKMKYKDTTTSNMRNYLQL